MPRQKPQGLRFDPRVISARIDQRCGEFKRTVKHMCGVTGLKRWDWSRRVNDEVEFRMEEISLIAVDLDGPLGWPYLDAELGEHIERLLEKQKKTQK